MMQEIAIGSPEWIAARRDLVTATDIPVLLGLSPWRCEADLADEKLGLAEAQEETTRMRLGSFLEPFIARLYTERTGIAVTRWKNLAVHPGIPWAAASPDYRSRRRDRLVEIKRYSRVADGLPQHVEAQVQWQLGVTGYTRADVAILTSDDLLDPFPVLFDLEQFEALVEIAADFRRRLAEGGPFARDDARVRRDFPVDSGVYLPATPDLVDLVERYRAAKRNRVQAEDAEKTTASALRAVLLDASGIEGLLTYRKNADTTRVNWPAVAKAYRGLLTDVRPADELDAIESLHSEASQGPRVLRLLKENDQ